MKIPFIVLTQVHGTQADGKVVIQVTHITAFGNLYGRASEKRSFVQVTNPETLDRKITNLQDGCYVVVESFDEIMALIDKAQALVHALE